MVLGSVQQITAQNMVQNALPAWAMGGFVRPAFINPIISPKNSVFTDPILHKPIHWESNDTFNPGAGVFKDKILVLYRAEDHSGIGIGFRTSRLGMATSLDGMHFTRRSLPVFFPGEDSVKKYEWPGGCEDPRLAQAEDGRFWIYYTEWNRDLPRLGVASTLDFKHWKKYGPIFNHAYGGKFKNIANKSASILTYLKNGKQVIRKTPKGYFMYWGEHHVYGALSQDLIHWAPLLNKDSTLKELMSPRPGFFDSDLTECGPPALWTPKGILLFYNGKNRADTNRDSRFNADSYSAGQALFDAIDPEKFLNRLDIPFLRPREPFEKSGQYKNGTVFIEGMAYFKRKWFLYYGCADSRVGVAIFDPKHPAKPDPIQDFK